MKDARSTRAKVVGFLLGLGVVAGQPPAALAAEKGAHGAMAMSAQESMLAEVTPKRDVAEAPPFIELSIWRAIVPEDNQVTPERVALGEKLYFDTRLSADGTVACATCHDVSRGFTDRRPVSEGIRDQLGRRNAPTTMNALLFQTQFLDGRAPTLEEQAKLPIVNPIEMGMANGDAAVKAIAGDADYVKMFQVAYNREPNYDDIGRAIASFERTLVFLDAPFDAFVGGDPNAISADAKAGWTLFNGKARCVSCHQLNPANPLGTDNRFHNIGVAARHKDFERLAGEALKTLEKDDGIEEIDRLALETDLSELGRFLVTKQPANIGGFKTSQIRNIVLTAPYMHDGSMQTLWDVMDHYNKGGEANPYLDGGIEPLALTEKEIDQVVAFMASLSDARFAASNQKILAEQRAKAQKTRPFRDNELAMRKTIPFEERAKGGSK